MFANVFMPKKQKPIRLQNIGNYPSEKDYTSENSLSEDEKNFLSLVWSFEKKLNLRKKWELGSSILPFASSSSFERNSVEEIY